MRASSCARTPLCARSSRAFDRFFRDVRTDSQRPLVRDRLQIIADADGVSFALGHDRASAIRVIADIYNSIQSFAHWLNVRDQDDLLEAVLEPTQQLDDVESPRLVQRPEDLIQN